MPPVETDIMTLEEVAAYLKVKPQTLYTWAQEKKIPAAKLGKEWRFKKSLIDEWYLQHIDEKFNGVIESVRAKEDADNNGGKRS
ncbi:helix-turn-helix domain-containing protein [bacterium]|nr:helix-turn-helix domain-containing protein [bacterium]